MARLSLLIAAVVFISGGCLAAAPSSSPSARSSAPATTSNTASSVVSWSSATPAPFVTPSPTPAQTGILCRAEQLRIGGAGWIPPSQSTQSMMGSFSIWNVSGEPCLLEGTPTVAILDAAGHDLHVRDTAFSGQPAQPILLPADQTGVAASGTRPTGTGYVETQWWSLCDTAVAPGALELVISLPDGGALRTNVVSGPVAPCVPGMGSSFAVGPFEQVPAPAPTEPPAIPAQTLTLALEVPAQATRGQPFHYVAALTNPSGHPIALEPCPAYQESLLGQHSQVVADFYLNCTASPSIGPCETVRFAMVLDVPTSFALGEAALIWQLDPFFSQGLLPRQPAQKVTVRVIDQ